MAETTYGDSSRFLASLYSPASERPVLEALVGIESEVVASLQGRLDHNVAHIRLEWWREECERLATGSPVHPLTRALAAEFPASTAAVLSGLSGFVDVAVWDLAAATFETRRELAAYCERWATAMIVPAVVHADGDSSTWLAIATAMREIEMLNELTAEARAGKLRVPLDELDRAGIETSALTVTPCSAPLAALLSERHEALRSILTHLVAQVPRAAQPMLRGLLVWADVAWRRSRRTQSALPATPRRGSFPGVAGAWHGWIAARRAMNGRFRFS